MFVEREREPLEARRVVAIGLDAHPVQQLALDRGARDSGGAH